MHNESIPLIVKTTVGSSYIIIETFMSPPLHSISELRDYSGCILFDEYQVGLLIQDLTKIIALRPGEEASYSTISSTPMYV